MKILETVKGVFLRWNKSSRIMQIVIFYVKLYRVSQKCTQS